MTEGEDYRKKIKAFLASRIELPERESVWQWAERNIILTRRVTPRPGPYSTDWCPYVRGPQEDFTDPDASEIVLCWAARTSKTETALNCIRYTVAEDPQATLIVMPSENLGRSFSETRLQPSVDDCPRLAREKPINADKFKLLEMHFKRCTLWVVGANSPANLKGRGVTVLYCDEIDTWPRATEKETGALEQVLERTKDRWNRKHILSSTPTVESGQIWREFLLGDQRYFFIPCPRCGTHQRLDFRQVKWPEDAKTADGAWDLEKVRANTVYECPHCRGTWRDNEKPDALTRGEWRPTARGRNARRRSYHLSALYPVWLRFGEVAINFLEAKDDPEKLQRFVNSWLAEPWKAWGNDDELMLQLEGLKEAEAPAVPAGWKPIMSMDVQADRIYYVVRAHAPNKDSVLVDYGVLPDWHEADVVAKRHGAFVVFVDARFRPQIVVEECAARRGWVPTQGTDGLFQSLRWARATVDGGLMKGKEIRKLLFRPNDWKDEIQRRMDGKGPKWKLHALTGEDYKKQIAGEHVLEKKGPRGQTVRQWIKHGANHYLDCETMQLAGFEAVRGFLFDLPAPTGTDKPPALPPAPPPSDPDFDGRGPGPASFGPQPDKVLKWGNLQ